MTIEPNRVERCDRCHFWEGKFNEEENEMEGFCHRYAPRPTNDLERTVIVHLVALTQNTLSDQDRDAGWADTNTSYGCPFWPETLPSDWCGEFRP